MNITKAMQFYLEKAIDERLKIAYPKSYSPSNPNMDKIKQATLRGIKRQPPTTLSNAFRLASRDAELLMERPRGDRITTVSEHSTDERN